MAGNHRQCGDNDALENGIMANLDNLSISDGGFSVVETEYHRWHVKLHLIADDVVYWDISCFDLERKLEGGGADPDGWCDAEFDFAGSESELDVFSGDARISIHFPAMPEIPSDGATLDVLGMERGVLPVLFVDGLFFGRLDSVRANFPRTFADMGRWISEKESRSDKER